LTRTRLLTVPVLVRDYSRQYLGPQGALWRTLRLLLTRPGQLTLEFLAGRRRRYLHPFRLYLLVSALFFLLASLTTHWEVRTPQVDVKVEQDAGSGADPLIECGSPAWLCERLKRRYNVAPELLQREAAAVPLRIFNFAGYGMFVLMPLYAALLLAVYRKRRRLYAEHLVFALYLHSFWFLGLAAMVALPPASLVALPVMVVYALLALRCVYGSRWLPTLARAALLSVVYSAAVGLVLAAAALAAVIL
jgi:hypothetical protein